jgi:hypothetical protein
MVKPKTTTSAPDRRLQYPKTTAWGDFSLNLKRTQKLLHLFLQCQTDLRLRGGFPPPLKCSINRSSPSFEASATSVPDCIWATSLCQPRTADEMMVLLHCRSLHDFEHFDFLHLETIRTREKRVSGQSSVIYVFGTKGSGVTLGAHVALIQNSNVRKGRAPFRQTIDCFAFLFAFYHKFPCTDIMRILQREKETLRTIIHRVLPVN